MSSTTIVNDSRRSDTPAAASDILALVIAWCAESPARAGEIAVIGNPGTASVLGRGEGEAPKEARLQFFRQRPGIIEPTPPLGSSGISRRQLLVTATDGGVSVERVGQCALEVNGVRVDRAELLPGDVAHLRRELVLQCVRRPALVPPLRLYPRSGMRDFGQPDGFDIIGESPAAWRLREAIAFSARADVHVLVLGESGTGKELAARAVHALSTRAKRAFVARNAATLPAGLIDAELFGHAKNYPNPGMAERVGLIGEADGGTLFLDEVGELPSELQAHLLRVLDGDGEYQRLGESQMRRSAFRLVAATNRDPSTLKHDFLARFTAQIELPSLEARREDTPLLFRNLLERAARRSPEIAARFTHVDPELVVHLLRRAFPTNIRELDGILWKAMAESSGDTLELPSQWREPSAPRPASTPPSAPRPEPTADEIRAALAAHGGSVPKAATALGLSSRYALYRLMKRHEIDA